MSLHSFFEDEKADGPFTILTVCTGNICRSPLVEMLLRKVLHGLPVVVHSAGTQALVGRPMTEQNCIIAEELGVQQVDDHRARLLKTDYLREADLVLVLTREHRAAVVEMLPRASRRVFTLREFSRITEAADVAELGPVAEAALGVDATGDAERVERLRAAVELVAQMRGSVPPPEELADDDVADPYRQSDEVYARSARQIITAVNPAGRFLRGAASRSLV